MDALARLIARPWVNVRADFRSASRAGDARPGQRVSG